MKERGLVIDLFAGGGGASIGIEGALGHSVDVAINHDEEAIRVHEINHPESKHYHCDIWEVDPLEATDGKPVDLLWASPDCTFFSKARGAKPFRDRKFANRRRALATVVCAWAKLTRPKTIALENVEEFVHWGPLKKDGTPCPKRKGASFKRWVRRLENMGYTVEWRELKACDYGTPTTRKRLFIVATLEGAPTWPEATHGEGLEPYHTAAEIIDWQEPTKSIFERKRPLAEATMARIARGIMKYVIEDDDPYIVEGKGATLIQTGYGERPGQTPRVPGLHQPLGTVVAGGCKHALVTAHLSKFYGTATGSDIQEPVHTVTSGGQKHALVVSYLARHWGGMTGKRVDEPFPTITTKGCQDQIVEATLKPAKPFKRGEVRSFLMKYYGKGTGSELREPVHTLRTKECMAIVEVAGVDYEIVDIGMRMLTPRELYRAQGFPEDYKIDVTLPKSAGAMGVKPKKLTKTAQIRLVGNSVCPPVAQAIVLANMPGV